MNSLPSQTNDRRAPRPMDQVELDDIHLNCKAEGIDCRMWFATDAATSAMLGFRLVPANDTRLPNLSSLGL
jgi:hypothetical protein